MKTSPWLKLCKRVAKSSCWQSYFLGASCPLQRRWTHAHFRNSNAALGSPGACYSNDFNRQVIAACLAPGVSTAAVALSNGLNANLVRRWVVESSPRSDSRQIKATTALAPVHGKPGFVPVRFDPVSPAANIASTDIQIELQHGSTTVQIQWPLQASSQCALWLREVLA